MADDVRLAPDPSLPSAQVSIPRRRGASLRDLTRAALFLSEVLPLLPVQPLRWLTRPPKKQTITFAGPGGDRVGYLYRPAGGGRRAGAVLFLGAAEMTMGVDDAWERVPAGRSSVYRIREEQRSCVP